MRHLTLEEILLLHFQVVEGFGGRHGVRDEARIQSVISAPCQAAFGIEQYPGTFEKAAVYLHNIINDHPFTDGNKRSGLTVGVVFLMLNNVRLTVSAIELADFAVQVAVERLEIPAIAAWLQTHSQAA